MALIDSVAVLILLGGSALGPHRAVDHRAGSAQADRLLAQSDPVGPCSPYRAEDGDIASELPGCAWRRRPAPGTLADELQFRRGRLRDGAGSWDPDPLAGGDPPGRATRGRPARRGPAWDDD